MMADDSNIRMNVSLSPVLSDIEKSHISLAVSNEIGDLQDTAKETFVKPQIHVEILQDSRSTLSSENVILLAHKTLKNISSVVDDVILTEFEEPDAQQHIKSISLNISNPDGDKGVCVEESKLDYHLFRLNTDTVDTESIEAEGVAAATNWVLPAAEFHGLWENLIYDTDIKSELLKFVTQSLLFAEKGVNPKVISWNKVVLLHGPPGTGKTSLCKALAQKLSIRLSHKYNYGQLIEINSHSLFSKWFSESGKLVMKMFEKINETIYDPNALIFVLIDEVESLAHSRTASLGGGDPSDSVRVVNALLTQLDKIKQYPNVVILTTSNITEAIDVALVDRADIKLYVGLPSAAAIYQIYSSCIKELQRKGLVYTKEAILPVHMLSTAHMYKSEMMQCSLQLKEIAQQSTGLSGRALRKMPYLAFSSYIQSSTTLAGFLYALSRTVAKEFQEAEYLKKGQQTRGRKAANSFN